MRSAIVDLWTSLRSRGLRETVRALYVGYLKLNHFLVFHIALKSLKPAPPLPEGITVRLLTLPELAALRTAHPEALPFEFHCDTTRHFSTPFVAFVDGEIAAIHWLVLPGEHSRFLTLGSGDVELNYNTVLPKFRGRRLAQVLMAEVMQWAQAKGYSRMFGVVHVVNVQQFKPMIDLGFRPVELVTHFAVFRPKATLAFVKP